MKKVTTLFAVLLFTCSLYSNAQSFDRAMEYLDFIAENQEGITKQMWKYTKAVAHRKSDRNIRSKRNSLLKTLDRAIAKIQKANGYDGNEYKNQVLEHMQFNQNLLNRDYAKIIDMKEVAEQSYDLMEAYITAQEMAEEKMRTSQQEYEINLFNFAKKHNIEIVENESDLSKNMKLSNEVFSHYNDMYLVFFKVHINQIYLWEAMDTNDVSSIQQNANALNQAAKEGLTVLDSVETYKNDSSIVEATRDVFQFYIDETENSILEITDFLILNEDFENIQKSIDKTPKRKRTKEQVDAYNKKVKEVNKAINHYNKVNQKLNAESEKAINALNMANEKFLARHIPKD